MERIKEFWFAVKLPSLRVCCSKVFGLTRAKCCESGLEVPAVSDVHAKSLAAIALHHPVVLHGNRGFVIVVA